VAVIRAAARWWIGSVARSISTADSRCDLHVRIGRTKSVCISGRPPRSKSYLWRSVVHRPRAKSPAQEAIHPDTLFCSENAGFVQIVETTTLTLSDHKRHTSRIQMGGQIPAKDTMERAWRCPSVPGSDGWAFGPTLADAKAYRRGNRLSGDHQCNRTGWWWQKGMKWPKTAAEMERAFMTARGRGKIGILATTKVLYAEKYLTTPRPHRNQVFGDGKGRAVPLGRTRMFACKRATRKVFEEAPARRSPPKNVRVSARSVQICDRQQQLHCGAGERRIPVLETASFYFSK